MIRYECDKCGARLTANDANRFIVKMEVYAAAGHLEFDADAVENAGEELDAILSQLRSADPDEIEDQTYRSFRFDVCNSCRKELLAKPLG